jgi:GntR family transcriptional repressor for pyruvate dehydrogenase complex
MNFGPVKRSALAEEIADKLMSLIRDKELKAGDRLPPERELAVMLEVSRPSLREALRALSIMKIIEMRQGDGTYISSLEPDQLVGHLDFVFSLDASTFAQLFEARRIVEVGLAGLAAHRITDEQIEALEACVERYAQITGSPAEALQLDLDLHELITAAAGNPMLSRFMASISRLGLASRARTVAIPGVPQKTVEDHRAIVEALKRREPAAARDAMLKHLNNVEQRLLDMLEREDAPTG